MEKTAMVLFLSKVVQWEAGRLQGADEGSDFFQRTVFARAAAARQAVVQRQWRQTAYRGAGAGRCQAGAVLFGFVTERIFLRRQDQRRRQAFQPALLQWRCIGMHAVRHPG